MKNDLTEPFWVNPDLGMQYTGSILDLDGLQGPITIEGNTFTGNTLKYQNCDIGRKMNLNTAPTAPDDYPSYGTKSRLQIKSLISVVNHDYDFRLIGNTFTYNSGTKGIVYLDMNHRETNVRTLIAQNTFTGNAGYLDSSVIHLRARGPSGTDVNSAGPNSDNLFCAGYHIQGNVFTNNFGCSSSVGGVIKFECLNSDAVSTDPADRFTFASLTTPLPEQYMAVDQSTYVTTLKTVLWSTFTYDMDLVKATFKSNTYTENYVSNGKGLVDISGVPRIFIESEIFNSNGDACKEAIVKYGVPNAVMAVGIGETAM